MAYTRVTPGMQYGRLTVIELCGRSRANKKMWKCRCDCGGEVTPTSGALNSGHTQSCGCLSREVARENRKKEQKHGATVNASPTPTYVSWVSMRKRCLSVVNKGYKEWGGRGISIDPRWDDYLKFLSDMGERPTGRTLDRIDNNGNYCKENCRWADAKTQIRNRRVSKLKEEDIPKIRADCREQVVIAKEFGVCRSLISNIKRGRAWRD